jgi:hypothetical protein
LESKNKKSSRTIYIITLQSFRQLRLVPYVEHTLLGCSLRIWQDFFPGSLAGFWVRIRFFFQNPARKKNPAGQEYEILAEKNSCQDFLVIPAGISCRAAGKNGPARLLRNGLVSTSFFPSREKKEKERKRNMKELT